MSREVMVYVNGVAQKEGEDYAVIGEANGSPMIRWSDSVYPPEKDDDVRVEWVINVEDDAVDQLADVVLPEEERKRRRSARNLRRLLVTGVQLGISSRGIKPK